MKKVNKIVHLVSNKEWGGGEQYVYDLCSHLIERGYPVELFIRPVEQVAKRMQQLGIPIHKARLGGVPDIASAAKLATYLKRQKEERITIHAHNFKDAFTAAYARLLSGKKNIRIVVTRHLVREAKHSFLYRRLYKQIDCIIFVSELAKEAFLKTAPAIDGSRLKVVKNSICIPDKITAIDCRKALSLPTDSVVTMYHGRLAEEKGIGVLLQAIARLQHKNISLVLIGRSDEKYATTIQNIIKEYKLERKIFFAGYQSPVFPWLGSCDIGVLPSTVAESSSLACMEYMACGRAIVTTNHGGQAEYLTDQRNALLVPPNDVEALAAAINTLIDNTELRKALGYKAQADFEKNLSYSRFLQQIEDIYDR